MIEKRSIIALVAYAICNVFSPFLLMLTQISYGLGVTAEQAAQQEIFSDAQRATMASLISFSTSIMFGVTALLLGALSDLFSPAIALFIILAAKSVVVLSLYHTLYAKHGQAPEKQPAKTPVQPAC